MSLLCPKTPTAPDPVATANAQGAANIESAKATTQLGNPNIVNPYGSSTTQYGTNAFFAANPEAAKSFASNSYGLSAEDYAKLYSKDRPGMAKRSRTLRRRAQQLNTGISPGRCVRCFPGFPVGAHSPSGGSPRSPSTSGGERRRDVVVWKRFSRQVGR